MCTKPFNDSSNNGNKNTYLTSMLSKYENAKMYGPFTYLADENGTPLHNFHVINNKEWTHYYASRVKTD